MMPRHARAGVAVVVWRWTSCTQNAPSHVRAALRRALAQLGYEGEAISDVVLAVSELAANADEHAVGPYELRLRRTAGECICEVVDHDPRIPEIPSLPQGAPFAPVESDRGGGIDALCALLAERGRGLQIVHELTKGAWGFRRQRGTKVAWVALPLPGGAHVARQDDDSCSGRHRGVGDLYDGDR
jgi:anti-sigma regulatory factor (Ser/Thr protein kinase)